MKINEKEINFTVENLYANKAIDFIKTRNRKNNIFRKIVRYYWMIKSKRFPYQHPAKIVEFLYTAANLILCNLLIYISLLLIDWEKSGTLDKYYLFLNIAIVANYFYISILIKREKVTNAVCEKVIGRTKGSL